MFQNFNRYIYRKSHLGRLRLIWKWNIRIYPEEFHINTRYWIRLMTEIIVEHLQMRHSTPGIRKSWRGCACVYVCVCVCVCVCVFCVWARMRTRWTIAFFKLCSDQRLRIFAKGSLTDTSNIVLPSTPRPSYWYISCRFRLMLKFWKHSYFLPFWPYHLSILIY